MKTRARALRKRRRDAVTEAVLDAAEAVIARKGYERATVQDVAAEAGCAAGTLYLYFTNKEDLLAGIVARHGRTLCAQMMKNFAGPGEPIRKISRNLECLIDYFNGHRTSFFIIFSSGILTPLGDIAAGIKSRLPAPREGEALCRAERAVIREAQARGQVRRDVSAENIQRFMHGLTMGVLANWSLASRAPPRETQIKLLWSFMTGGIGAKVGAGR